MSSKCETSAEKKVDPYLFFPGNAAEARDFYATVFGGTTPFTSYYDDHKGEGMPVSASTDKKLIMHTTVTFGNNSLMMCDHCDGTAAIVGNNATLCISFDDLDKMTKVYNDLSSGGKIKVPLALQFWGDHYGLLEDKFGVIWGFNCAVKTEGGPDPKETGDPTGMKVNAYFYFHGKAAAARDFYTRVFGGFVPYTGLWKDHKCEGVTFPEDKLDLVMHTSVNFGKNCIMMCDHHETEETIGNNVTYCVSFDDMDRMKKVFNDMTESGKIKVPLAAQFWGAHYGLLQDKFGIIWGFHCEIKGEGEPDAKKQKTDA